MKDIMKILFFLDVICLVYLFVRGPWLFRVKGEYNRKVYALVTRQKGEPKTQAEMDELSPYLSVYYDAIWRFPRLLFCFWKWNLSKMVNDQDKFKDVMNFSKGEKIW